MIAFHAWNRSVEGLRAPAEVRGLLWFQYRPVDVAELTSNPTLRGGEVPFF
jgi:hypothetical protein